ncbi:hypothetical protein EON65_19520 [archaeon]|nr:MAG: hypothetical protein EON65_19520 [archaeon]
MTDICGQPGVGKTQLCMMSAIEAVLQGQGVVYIDTEQKFDPTRLVHIATHTYPTVYSHMYSTDAAHKLDSLLQHIQVHRPKTTSEFSNVVDQLQVQAIEHKVSLVVIDSIAALVKQEGMDEKQREKFVMAQVRVR